MIVTNLRHYFSESLAELIGIRSGLMINRDHQRRLLGSGSAGTPEWPQGDPLVFVSVRAEELRDAFARLLWSVRATPDKRAPIELVYDSCMENLPQLPPERCLAGSLPDDLAAVMGASQDLMAWAIDGLPLSPTLGALGGLAELRRELRLRDLRLNCLPEHRQWDGNLGLEHLFSSPGVSGDKETYFEQRFIDYLNAQPGDIASIHWRQFERIVAEFFLRRGYDVKISSGTDDGGVDVSVRRITDIPGPEIIVIQCKRHKPNAPVGVDVVRAFYSTVADECATRGLVVTTSRLTSGGRKYCDARKHRLSSADGENVRDCSVECL